VTVSVVIPLFNRYDLTAACLASLTNTRAELVLVDNASTDATALLDVAVRNNSNMGFAHACNQGAQAATGDVLVFLNNDTEVHDGWLGPLVDELADPTVGIVGSRLLYPDGTIQHSGVCVDLNQPVGLEAWNRKDDWTLIPTDVDAVTGACLAIRADTFAVLGGFDEGYRNGYEDVDLCLSALGAGLRVVYQPESVVTHHESQSGPTRFAHAADNIHRLRHKWSDAA
jgi:O-antigen biosynthesis protein